MVLFQFRLGIATLFEGKKRKKEKRVLLNRFLATIFVGREMTLSSHICGLKPRDFERRNLTYFNETS